MADVGSDLYAEIEELRQQIKDVDRQASDARQEALEARNTARAETLVRDHALGLAEHVAKHADYLD